MIILIFGQPASGKTTLAKEFLIKKDDKIDEIDERNEIHIDGDEWREITKNKNYTKEGRMQNLKGAFDMALYLEKKGYDIVLSFVTPYEELRQYLRDNAEELIEIYLTYSGDRGRNSYFVNEFDVPSGSYLHLDTSELTIDECIEKIMDYIIK
jgi:adenylylsulfate kinase